jgi:replicative DNA helicase
LSTNNEDYILISLITNPEYLSRVYSKLKPKFFENYLPQTVFKYIQNTIKSDIPVTFDGIKMMVNSDTKIVKDDEQKEELIKYIQDLKDEEINIPIETLLKETEKWAKLNSFRNGLIDSIEIVKKENNNEAFKKAMGIIEDAFDVSFNEDDRFSMTFNSEEDRKRRIRALKDTNSFKSGFTPFDDLTGGLRPKTLNCLLSPTNMGKTLSMSFLGACYALQGLNVAIASLEISPEEYLQRIDANMLDISTYDMTSMDEEDIMLKFKKFDESKNCGIIECQQFSEASVIDIKMWLKKLYIEKKYKPDIVIIDYIGLMKSLYVTDRSNTYVVEKEVSREVRQQICIDMGYPVLSAVQSNRATEHKIKKDGKDVDVTSADTANSYGVPQNLDTYISQVEIKEIGEHNKNNDVTSIYIWQLIKSRNHIETGRRVKVGVSKNKQRLYTINDGNLDITNYATEEIDEVKKEKERSWFDDTFNF